MSTFHFKVSCGPMVLLVLSFGILSCGEGYPKQKEPALREKESQQKKEEPIQKIDSASKARTGEIIAPRTIPLPDVTYDYDYFDLEYKMIMGSCKVIIYGDSIKVNSDVYRQKGKVEILEKGILVKHTKTGKWIIAKSSYDKNVENIFDFGWIDFKMKRYCTY